VSLAMHPSQLISPLKEILKIHAEYNPLSSIPELDQAAARTHAPLRC